MALFPQFVPQDSNVLEATLLMACSWLWYGSVAYGVARAKRAFVRSSVARRIEQLTGAVLVGLSLRLAVERG